MISRRTYDWSFSSALQFLDRSRVWNMLRSVIKARWRVER